jgi:hypothetical protein
VVRSVAQADAEACSAAHRDELGHALPIGDPIGSRMTPALAIGDAELRALAQRWHELAPEVRRALLVLAGINTAGSS